MTDMKMSAEESAEYPDTVMANRPLYPWGLQISLDDDSLKKLGLKKLPDLDQVIEIKCKAQVTAVHSMKNGDDDDESSCQLQITAMEVVEDSAGKPSKLYKSSGA